MTLMQSRRHANNSSRAGGMFIIGGHGKIEINNTLEERLKICETDALPAVRITLFGKNENRKFTD
jgi:V-type H+-transporting ATPase subunit E